MDFKIEITKLIKNSRTGFEAGTAERYGFVKKLYRLLSAHNISNAEVDNYWLQSRS